jgi:hypothetical protein
MIAAFRFASLITQRMVIASCCYHVAKITLVAVDARRRYSPQFGIMRLLMDHWHLKSALDILVSIKRFSLQVFSVIQQLLKLSSLSHHIGQQLQRFCAATSEDVVLTLLCCM